MSDDTTLDSGSVGYQESSAGSIQDEDGHLRPSSLPTDLESLRKATRELLSRAAGSGVLQSTLAGVPKRPEVNLESVRSRIRGVLVNASADGRLEDILVQMNEQEAGTEGDIGEGQETRSPSKTQDLRKFLQKAFTTAAKDGSLEVAMKEAKVSALRAKAKEVFAKAATDGRLVAELKLGMPKENERVRSRAKQLLFEANSSGRLTQMLDGIRKSSPETEELNVNAIRMKAREAISRAYLDGSLVEEFRAVRAAKEPAPTDLEKLRLEAKSVLCQAFHDGRLPKVLEKVQRQVDGQQASEQKFSIDVIREKALETVQKAALDGSLRDSVSKVRASREEQAGAQLAAAARAADLFDSLRATKRAKEEVRPAPEIEDLRTQVRRTLMNAAFDGTLKSVASDVRLEEDTALASSKGQRKAGSQDLRKLARQSLTAALRSGTLENALDIAECEARQKEAQRELEVTRQLAKEAISRAASEGKLQAVIQNMRQEIPQEPPKAQQLEETRRSARRLISQAALDGRLESALGTAQPNRQLQDAVSARNVLAAGARDGRLMEALAEVKRARENSGMEALRQQAQATLMKGALDGRLEAIVEEVKTQKATKPEPEQQDIAALRSELQAILVRSAHSGQLAEALQTNSKARVPTSMLDGRLSALRRKQKEKAESGTTAVASSDHPPAMKNQVFEDGTVCRTSRRMTCNTGLSASLRREFLETAHTLRYSEEEEDFGSKSEENATLVEEEKISASPPSTKPSSAHQRRRIIGAVGRAPKAATSCVDLTGDPGTEEAPIRHSSPARGHDAAVPFLQSEAMKESFGAMTAFSPPSPAGRPPTPPTAQPPSSRRSARHRMHLAASSAMAMDLGDDARPPSGDGAGAANHSVMSAMSLDLGLNGARWSGGLRAATPADRIRTSQSASALRTSKQQGSTSIAFTVPPAAQAFSMKGNTVLPALPGHARSSSASISWNQQHTRSSLRWTSTQAVF